MNGGSSNDAMEVYCDMTTDGGGWTFVAFYANESLNEPVQMLSFFNQAVGEYQSSRVATSEHYSLGVLPEIDDTEMMIVTKNVDPETSKQLKGFVHLKYQASSPGFNFGPIPCTPSSFEFKANAGGYDFLPGYMGRCTDTRWELMAHNAFKGVNNLLLLYKTYPGINGFNHVTYPANNVYIKPAWFYVR